MFFEYGKKEIAWLKNRDATLEIVIDKIGHIQKKVNPDIFSSLVHQIIGQQISMAAQKTIYKRLIEETGSISVNKINDMPLELFHKIGISPKKAESIKGIAQSIKSGTLELKSLYKMDDDKIIQTLCKLKGIGEWTAQMTLIFSMQRPDVLSFGDFAIQKGLRMLYHHRKITPTLFAKYKKRYSPYASVASLYLWEIAGGTIPGMKDYQPKKIKRNV